MTQSGNNVLRTILTIILLLVIAVLVYILSQKSMNDTDVSNIGVTSPVAASAQRDTIPYDFDRFNDGLAKPNVQTKNAPDEFGVGVTDVRIYNRDLNNDGRPDKITRTHIENGTSHFTNEYKIELATDIGYIDITPDNLKTIEGADCALQKLRFYFDPVFMIEKIGRNIGEDYLTPTMAYKTIYKMIDNQLVQISQTPITEICDVSELFN
ncbi:MAG: hypothetical protein ACI4NZ_03805 [Candidatus Enterousia sp.]